MNPRIVFQAPSTIGNETLQEQIVLGRKLLDASRNQHIRTFGIGSHDIDQLDSAAQVLVMQNTIDAD